MKWTLNELTKTIVASLLNKYDFFLAVEGNTGTGKSTLAFHIASKVSKEFHKLYMLRYDTIEYYYERIGRKMGLTEQEFLDKILKLKEKNRYKFIPQKALIYTQDDLQKFLAGWHGISIPDEMINITFNRDFHTEKQKDIIKMLNMFRDHENLTLACVPSFQNLDNQIKNLTKMKITVKKRGVAIIHTPNSVVYCKDKWDSATNEKIERSWIMKKVRNPNYSKLTTFRGLVRFPPLSRKQEAMYQNIKNDKRAVVLKDDMKINADNEEAKDPVNMLYNDVINGGIRNMDIIRGYAKAMGITVDALVGRIVTKLKKDGKPYVVSQYLWGKTKKDREANKEFDGL